MESASQLSITLLELADKKATLALNGLSGAFGDVFWMFMSNKFVWIPLYLLIIYGFFRRLGWRRALLGILFAGLCIAACDQCANLFKHGFCRMRPNQDAFMIERGLDVLEKGGLYGFFSGHAANSFAVATIYMVISQLSSHPRMRRWTAGLFVWAFLVSASRIFVGKHFLGDVLVGATMGMLLTTIIWRAFKPLIYRVK